MGRQRSPVVVLNRELSASLQGFLHSRQSVRATSGEGQEPHEFITVRHRQNISTGNVS